MTRTSIDFFDTAADAADSAASLRRVGLGAGTSAPGGPSVARTSCLELRMLERSQCATLTHSCCGGSV